MNSMLELSNLGTPQKLLTNSDGHRSLVYILYLLNILLLVLSSKDILDRTGRSKRALVLSHASVLRAMELKTERHMPTCSMRPA